MLNNIIADRCSHSYLPVAQQDTLSNEHRRSELQLSEFLGASGCRKRMQHAPPSEISKVIVQYEEYQRR